MHHYLEYGGGLGDIFNQMYSLNSYAFLETLGPRDTVLVALITHNPFVRELFDYHPNVGRMTVLTPGYWLPENDRRMRPLHNLPWPPPMRPTCSKPVRFFPASADQRILSELESRPYVLMAASAGLPERSLPPDLTDRLTAAILRKDLLPVFTGRTYDRAGRTEYVPSIPGVLNLVDQLTVPGVAEALRRARAVVTCHSALNILAWHMRRPQLLLYSQSTRTRHFLRPDEWSFGKDFPETRHGLFDDPGAGRWLDEILGLAPL